MPLHPDAARNRAAWDADSADYQRRHGPQLDTRPLAWGVWALPESELRLLPPTAGRDVLELGCGAAQWAAFLAEAGARVTALDNSGEQLAAARRFLASRGLDLPLVHASADDVPLPDGAFDLVFCDHGALTFCDPERVLPEVHRLLRPGGHLVFNCAHPLVYCCWNDETDKPDTTLRMPWADLGRFEEPDSAVSWCLTPAMWLAAFRRHGFVVEDHRELFAPEDAETTYTSYADPEWAARFPAEQAWRVRRSAGDR